MDVICFSFTPAQRDYLITVRAFLLRRPLYLLIVFVLGLLSSLLWLLFSLSANRADALVFALPAVVMPFGLVALFLILAPIVMASLAANNAALTSELKCEASTAGLRVAGASADTVLNWKLFSEMIETKSYLLLIFQQRRKLFQMIPKRAFASTDDEARFREIARREIGE
jgi:hypothetical protein